MKIRFFMTALLVSLSFSMWAVDCVAVQADAKQLEESDQVTPVREVEPEKVPEVFGFNDGLKIVGTSANGNGFKTTILERTQDGELVRSAVVTLGSNEVSVKVTRQFGVDQRDELVEAFPQLTEDIGGFPRQVDDLDIELSVGIAKTFTAKDASEFEQKYPDIFRQYRSHLGAGQRRKVFADRGPPRLVPPRIIVRPEVRGAPMPRAGGRMVERIEGLVEETTQQLETAAQQVKLLEEALVAKRKELGDDHKSIARAEEVVAAAKNEADALAEKLAALKKSNELRKLDQLELDKIKPERKKSDDK